MGVVPVAIFKPSGSRDRSGAITPSKSGAVWDTTLDGAAAWRVLDGTTNLFTNPVMASNLNQVSTVGATSHTRRTDLVWTHPETGQPVGTGVEMVSTSSNHGAFVCAVSLPSGTALSGQFLFQATGAAIGKNVIALLYASGGANGPTGIGSALIAATGGVQLLKVENKLLDYTDRTTVSVYVQVQGISGAYAGSVIASACQLEAKAYATPLCPAKDGVGVILPGQQWNGTPDASTSTRTLGQMYSPIASSGIPVSQGAIYARAFTDNAAGFVTSAGYLYSIGQYGADAFSAIVRNVSPAIQAIVRQANATSFSGLLPVPQDQLVSVYQEWTPTTTALRVNGSSVSGARTTPTIWNATNFTIGYGGSQSWNGRIAALIFFDRPLTTQELAKLDVTPTALLGWDTLLDKPGGILRVGAPDLVSILRVGADPIAVIWGGI